MARIETWLDCDLKKIIRVHEIKGNVFTQDHLGNLIGVRVYDDGEPVTLAGSVNGYCILADGSTVPVDGDRDTSGNRAWIILPQSAYAVPGTIRITIKLTETDGDDVDHIVTLASLVGTVTRSKTDNMVTPSSQVITDWSQQISAEMQEVSDAAAAAAGNFAAAYSTTKTYSVGEYVTYNGALYRCTTAVTTAGSWSSNSAKFAAVKMGNDVADLKSAFNDYAHQRFLTLNENNSVKGWIASDSVSGYTDGQIVLNKHPDYFIKVIKVKKGNWIKASLGNSSTIYTLCYVSSSDISSATVTKSIIKGCCINYKYQFEEDGYIALCTNIRLADFNKYILYEDGDLVNPLDIGWKKGYTGVSGNSENDYYIYDSNYFISDDILLNVYDRLNVSCKASNNVYVFLLKNRKTGDVGRDSKGVTESQYTDYSLLSATYLKVNISARNVLNEIPEIEIIKYESFKAEPASDKTSLIEFENHTGLVLPSTVTDIPGKKAALLASNRCSTNLINQILYQRSGESIHRLLLRYISESQGVLTPTPWLELEQIKPGINTIYSNQPENKYQEKYADYTSIAQYVDAPFMANVSAQTELTDKPFNQNGVLIVLPSSSSGNTKYVLQIYYVYNKGKILTRLVGVNKNTGIITPHSDWHCVDTPLYNKTILGLGDSLMYGSGLTPATDINLYDDTVDPNEMDITTLIGGTTQCWLNKLGKDEGAIIYNRGAGGNTVADYIENGTEKRGMVSRLDTIKNTFDANNIEIDYFVLIGGANDRNKHIPIGEITSTTRTEFCGALNIIITKVREYFPKAKMLFMTNYMRYETQASGDPHVEAMLNVCKNRHVFCFDNFRNSGVDFTDSNFSAWADVHQINPAMAQKHFSKEGYAWLYNKYKTLLESL